METALQRAARTVSTACAINSTFVKVISVDPFRVTPDNVFQLTFKNIGLVSDAQLAIFLKTLSDLLPELPPQSILSIGLNPSVVIGLVVDHVEALLLKLAAGGFDPPDNN
jgi:hypothetical protein